jgi:hypothetical protein
MLAHQGVQGQAKYLRSYSPDAVTGRIAGVIPSNSISHVVARGSTLWIGTGKGLARSNDGGRTWESFERDPAFTTTPVFSIGLLQDTVWAATGYTKEVQGSSVQTGSGYAWSTNDGAVWSHTAQQLDGVGDSMLTYGVNTVYMLPIVVPEQNVTFDIALTPGTLWTAGWSSGIRRSTNRGSTWERMVLPSRERNGIAPTDTLGAYRIDPRKDNNYLGFSVYAQSDSIIWAGTAGGVNRSPDGGKSWRKFTRYNQAAPIAGDWVISIAGQPLASSTRIWITTWPADGENQKYGVCASDDDGRSWSTLLAGMKAYGFAFKDSIVYVPTDDGLYRSSDGGRSWLKSGVITDRTGSIRLSSPSFFAAAVIGDTVYAGTSEGLVKTIDDGQRPFGQEWEVLRASRPLASANDTYVYPNPFSPRTEAARIRYAVPAGATVTIELFDFGMNRVRTLIHDASRTTAGEAEEVWDGRTDGGSTAKNGVYFYRVTVNGGDGRWGKVMVLQ